MALELRLGIKQTQTLVMSLHLQQAIKLLQLSHQELVDTVQKEMLENPALEEIPGTVTAHREDVEAHRQNNAQAETSDRAEQSNGVQEESIDWEKLLENSGRSNDLRSGTGPSRFDDLPPIEATLSSADSLAEHLLWQFNMQSCTTGEERAAKAIIHNLDHRGYLTCSAEEIMQETGSNEDDLEGALEIIAGMDPIGCGAANLVECLILQAEHHWPEDPYICQIIERHLPSLETRNYPAIVKDLDIELEDVLEYHRMIKTMEPWPGRPFGEGPSQYITPDIEVVKVGDEWQILQNEDGLPRLRVSGHYRDILKNALSSKQDKKYIKEKLESASFLIKSIYKRQQTIHKVMECILERQQAFFDHGAEHLLPMVLRDVADAIEMHESTVSRVTTNKYMQCPHGIFELKYFFNAGIQRTNGADLAAEAVKHKIKKIIAEENPQKPLSDAKIVKCLEEQQIKIARRTVAKYREAMGILSGSHRKRLF